MKRMRVEKVAPLEDLGAVIGHHDDEGIARFLRERFALDAPR
jgi:hypothetical protein